MEPPQPRKCAQPPSRPYPVRGRHQHRLGGEAHAVARHAAMGVPEDARREAEGAALAVEHQPAGDVPDAAQPDTPGVELHLARRRHGAPCARQPPVQGRDGLLRAPRAIEHALGRARRARRLRAVAQGVHVEPPQPAPRPAQAHDVAVVLGVAERPHVEAEGGLGRPRPSEVEPRPHRHPVPGLPVDLVAPDAVDGELVRHPAHRAETAAHGARGGVAVLQRESHVLDARPEVEREDVEGRLREAHLPQLHHPRAVGELGLVGGELARRQLHPPPRPVAVAHPPRDRAQARAQQHLRGVGAGRLLREQPHAPVTLPASPASAVTSATTACPRPRRLAS